ncbi:HAD-IC family P-type ATPase [Candidatus Saccharibacteria bacterium]|nr:HAD-IC family P-type ATPase [Candidatus Saccharibacteria bacterium]
MHNKDLNDIYEQLGSGPDGLTPSQAKAKLLSYGENILPKKPRPSFLKLYLKEFKSPIELILVFTVIVSFLVGEAVDAMVIIFIILVDTIMGAYQENKALKSTESLNGLLKSKTKVIRAGRQILIDSEDLVPGDIILLSSGDKINADARIIESANLQVNESILTGESVNIEKSPGVLKENTILAERTNMLHAGCSIVTGRAKAIAVSTGVATEIGQIYEQVVVTEGAKTPLTLRMEKFSRQISIIIIVIAIISGIILYFNGHSPSGIFLSVVALAISAMPEGLPLALTMALTIASNKMSRYNVIVKSLNSVEALGSCTVIASDKTGTLTVNEQTARQIVLSSGETINITGTGYNDNGSVETTAENHAAVNRIINLCALNNEASFKKEKDKYKYLGDSIDIALLVLREKLASSLELKREKIIPYESEKQYSAAFYTEKGKLRCTVKGSLEKVMEFSHYDKEMILRNEKLSRAGYRVLAVCDGVVKSTKEEELKGLNFLGLIAFIDPIRPDAAAAIKECKAAGIKVIMITGDHPATALTIAEELGLAADKFAVTTGTELGAAFEKGEHAFNKFVRSKTVFSRVTPIDKLRIVEALKKTGEYVAVTGDGVNDAPAIKAANIGVAFGSGTDVAIDTADLVLMDDKFSSIVAGVREGRVAYANIRKIILFLLSCGMAEVLFYLFAVCMGYELPLVAIQLLWINIVTDGLQDMALSFEKGGKNIMKERPRRTTEPLLGSGLMAEIGIFGLTIAIFTIIIWKYLIDHGVDLVTARSIIMLFMVFVQNLHVLNCRSEKSSIFKTPIFTNPLLTFTILGSILLQLIIMNIPMLAGFLEITSLPLNAIGVTFACSLIIIIVGETYKIIYRLAKRKR